MSAEIKIDAPTKKNRILIVDDEARFVDSLEILLENWGYDVLTAPNGAKAAGLLVTKDIDVVLLDLHMPVADGHKVMSYIKDRRLTTRVIAISGDPTLDDAITSLNQGADKFLRKPVSAEELKEAIVSSLNELDKEKQGAKQEKITSTTPHLHRLMFNISPSLMFLLDTKGCFRMANKVFLKALGYAEREIIGKHWSTLVEDEMIAKIHHVFEERRNNSGHTPDVEIRLKCKDQTSDANNTKSRYILISLQSIRIYSQRDDKKIFLGTYGVARDITHKNKLEELKKYQEFYDTLTGLPNRILFDDYLTFAISHAVHEHTSLGIVLITLDDLKLINERYGHSVGDNCLENIVSRLKDQVRRADTLSRIDGSEFALLLPNIHQESSLLHLIKEIRKNLTTSIEAEGKSITLSISIGKSLYPQDGKSADELIRHAQSNHEVTLHSQYKVTKNV